MVKEKFGLVVSRFTPIIAMPAGSHPTYGTAIDMGEAVKAYLTATYANAKLYGDDVLQLEANEFTYATLQAETLLSDLQVKSQLFGGAYANGELSDNVDDTAVPGAYEYIQKLKTKSGIIYRAVFLYNCVPSQLDDNADTKGESVTFANEAINYTVYPDDTGDWRKRKDFSTQAAAEAWLAQQRGAGSSFAINVLVSGSGSASPEGGMYVASGGSAVINLSGTPTKLFDNGTDKTTVVAANKYTITNVTANHNVVVIF